MNNGTLKPANLPADAGTGFAGSLVTWSLSCPIRLVPRGVAADTKDPTHDVEVRAPHGGAVPAGVAWAKTLKRGERRGEIMLSIVLDIPDVMPQSLSLAAFPREGGVWELTAERRRPGAPSPADQGADAPPLDDAIPY